MPAVQRRGPRAADRQRPHQPGPGHQPAAAPTPGPVIREAAPLPAGQGMRAAARDPIPREHGLRPIARQQEVTRAAQRQELQAADLRQAAVPIPGPLIREAVRLPAGHEMMDAAQDH